jgi:hypothetical protein
MYDEFVFILRTDVNSWRNVGTADRVIRLIIALVALVAALNTSGSVSIILWVVCAVGGISGILGYAPPYALLGISTVNKSSKRSGRRH